MPIPKSDFTLQRLQALMNFDHDVIDELLHSVSSYADQKHKYLATRTLDIQAEPPLDGVDKDWLVVLFDEEHYFLDEAQKLSHELAIVSLYKKIEIRTKLAMEVAYPDMPSKVFSNIGKLKGVLNEKGIQIELLPYYSAMDEIRCLNNAIKHSGVVSKELSAYSDWIKGQDLTNVKVAYRRLAPLCCHYMDALIVNLIQKRRDSIGNSDWGETRGQVEGQAPA